MVGIHVLQIPNLSVIGIVTNGTKRTIGFITFLFCRCRLLGIDCLFRRLVEYAYIQ